MELWGVDIWAFVIVCPLVMLAGFIDAIAGGGGLISLPAYMISGLPAHTVLGTNKFSSSVGTIVATCKYARNGYIDWKLVLPAVVTSIMGSWCGAHLALLVPDGIFAIVMLVILPVIAAYVLFHKRVFDEDLPGYDRRTTMLLVSLMAMALGLYDGFYGPGTGTFLMLALTGVAHVGLNSAAGITKVVNLTTNLSALSVFLYNGVVLLPLAVVAALFSMAGNYLGARTFTKHGAAIARPVVIIVITILFVKILFFS